MAIIKAPTKWQVFEKFTGWQTKFDPTKVDDGANVNGQNTSINDGDRISVRNWGYEKYPTTFSATATTGTNSLHTFRRRDGVSILMKAYNSNLEYYNPQSASWVVLKSTFTSGLKFGFADYNLNTDLSSKCFFGNGVDNFAFWRGGYTQFASASAGDNAVSAATLSSGGDGYVIGDVLTINDGGNNATITVSALNLRSIKTLSLLAAGSSYSVNDIVTISQTGSNNDATAKVLTIDGSGGITSIQIVNGGNNYSVSGIALNLVKAGGTGATATITAITNQSISTFTPTSVGSGYSIANNISLTGGSGSGAKINVTALSKYSIITSATGQISLEKSGFITTGGQIIINGNNLVYTGCFGNVFMGLSIDPTTLSLTAGMTISQAVEESSSNPKGNIYMVANNRLFISGCPVAPQAVYFSKYGDPADFTSSALVTGSTGTASGTFNFAEGGGAVIGCSQDEANHYWFKKSIVYKVTLSDTLYTLTALKPFDGKSQTSGAVNSRSVFTGGNGVFFITPDNQIVSLQRVEQYDYPQNVAISGIIKNTVKSINFDDSVGIVFQDKAYLACRSDNYTFNNTILVWNITLSAWDSPITGANVGDMTVYNDGNGDKMYFMSNTDNTVYKVNSTPIDDIYGVTANWRSKQFTFGVPSIEKYISNYFIEGYISQGTTLNISLFYDDNGFTQESTVTLVGTETGYLFNTSSYNILGLTAFGSQRFGSNDDIATRVKFRIYPKKNIRIQPFYNLQIDFSSDGENQQWEITSFGFKVGSHEQDERRSLYK